MYELALKEVLRTYGFTDYVVSSFQKGYRNEIWPILLSDNTKINVTFYKREAGIVERIRRADAVSEYLEAQGMPTRRRVRQEILQLKNAYGTTNIGVYTYLPGETIPWDAYTMTHIKLLGQTQSNMHALLSDARIDNLPSVYDEYLAIIGRMRRYFRQVSVRRAMQQKLKISIETHHLVDFKNALEESRLLPGQKPLHMDFVRGNILFDKATPGHGQQLDGLAISGILDFEKTALGHPVMDIARTLAFLLVDCKYKSADKVTKYFLHSGYQKRGEVNDIGDASLRARLVELFLLYDFYKFLRHNPYESLEANEHYVRTRDILLKHGVIRYEYKKVEGL